MFRGGREATPGTAALEICLPNCRSSAASCWSGGWRGAAVDDVARPAPARSAAITGISAHRLEPGPVEGAGTVFAHQTGGATLGIRATGCPHRGQQDRHIRLRSARTANPGTSSTSHDAPGLELAQVYERGRLLRQERGQHRLGDARLRTVLCQGNSSTNAQGLPCRPSPANHRRAEPCAGGRFSAVRMSVGRRNAEGPQRVPLARVPADGRRRLGRPGRPPLRGHADLGPPTGPDPAGTARSARRRRGLRRPRLPLLLHPPTPPRPRPRRPSRRDRGGRTGTAGRPSRLRRCPSPAGPS